jgi:hypothetical protein
MKYSEKISLSATLSTTNPKCYPDANQDRCRGKPANNRLSYGTTSYSTLHPHLLKWWRQDICYQLVNPFAHTLAWTSAVLSSVKILFESWSIVTRLFFPCLLVATVSEVLRCILPLNNIGATQYICCLLYYTSLRKGHKGNIMNISK